MSEMTRREFLRVAAGGLTTVALVPIGHGLFAAADPGLPLFTAMPYVQPGNTTVLRNGRESIVVAWQTEMRPADFVIEYGPTTSYGRKATIERTERRQGMTDRRFNYAALLGGLDLSRKYYYRLSGNGTVVAEGYFTTRKKRGQAIRFVAFGDNAYGDPGEKAVAYYAYQQNPDFIMNTGDNVYESGLDNQYVKYFYPVYNADKADPAVGAPLLRSVPFYTVIANHDVAHKDASHRPAADFDKDPDSLGYYTAMHLPLNGPTPGPNATPVIGDAAAIADFAVCAGHRFPLMANYSFDYGDAHFCCLDSNDYVDPTAPFLTDWIEKDLSSTDALWKFVVYHHPAYNVGEKHWHEQHMRVLSPLLEKHGVDFVLSGHEHVYQRTVPFTFKPTDVSNATPGGHGAVRTIPGDFTLDTTFDGKTNTRPNGVIYIGTGAGGKELYDMDMDGDPSKWKLAFDDKAYCAMFVSRAHSLTSFDIEGKELTMVQIDESGNEVDRIKVTKA